MNRRKDARIKRLVDAYIDFQDVIWALQHRQEDILKRIEHYSDEVKLGELKEQLANMAD